MISRLVVFGGTGDLAARYLFPALAAMHAADRLPERFAVTGAGREALSDDAFRHHVARALEAHAPDVPAASRGAIAAAVRYAATDIGDAADVGRAIGAGADRTPMAAYLALPPGVFPVAMRSLAHGGMPDGSRIAIEKPFGTNLDDARALNAIAAELFGVAVERVVFRVDHVLGMATAHTLIGLRIADGALDALWNSHVIEQVDVLWEETLGLEGRAEYFDTAGALRDVMQNHMIQVLALVAMEPPASLDPEDLRDAKARALAAVRIPPPDAMARLTRRARYGAGMLAAPVGRGPRNVPAYADEPGVDPDRETETLAEVMVEVDTPRWRGTRFVLRGGKALAERRKGVLVRFRPRGGGPPPHAEDDAGRSTFWIGIDGPEDMRLRLAAAAATTAGPAGAVVLRAPPPPTQLPPYGNVLADLLAGSSRLSVRGDEAEAAWRIVMPVLDAWSAGSVPIEEYRAGAARLPPRARESATPQGSDESTKPPEGAR